MKVAYAEGTFKNLKVQWESYLIFCYFYKLQPFPVDVHTLCLYAQFLSRSFRSVQSVRNYLSAVKTLHSLLDVKYPDSNLLQLNLLLRGIARVKQHVPKKASPITPHILREMFNYVNLENEKDCVVWSLILLMFFLMARKSNLIPNSSTSFDSSKQLTRRDIQLTDNMLIVTIKWSKTRHFGHFRQVPILAIPDCCLCPVSAYRNMIDRVTAHLDDPAFCISIKGKKSKLVPITYPQFQRRLRQLISYTGRDENSYSSHSLRRGGCTWAFKSKVNPELIQQHADWVSDCYKEYLSYDFHQKLSVSQKMSKKIINEI